MPRRVYEYSFLGCDGRWKHWSAEEKERENFEMEKGTYKTSFSGLLRCSQCLYDKREPRKHLSSSDQNAAPSLLHKTACLVSLERTTWPLKRKRLLQSARCLSRSLSSSSSPHSLDFLL